MNEHGFPINFTYFPHRHLRHFTHSLENQLPYQALRPSSTVDGVSLAIFLLILLGHLVRGRLWDKPDKHFHLYFERPQVGAHGATLSSGRTRDIPQRLEETSSRCIIFWGSQSGTSERFAEMLGREMLVNFGLNALVADPSEMDINTIQHIPKSCPAIFILSTYGEGDPSDNSISLWDWIKVVKDQGVSLSNLSYMALGLGNSNYKYYNRVIDVVADTLDAAGATALLPRQRADDANGGTEEDFQSWKDDLFSVLCGMGYEQKSVEYTPNIALSFTSDETGYASIQPSSLMMPSASSTNSAAVHLPIRAAYELFQKGDRNCLHIEVDLSNTDLVYKTGDHIGIWPCNPENQVDQLVEALGLQSRREESLSILSSDGTKLKIPSPTNINSMLRHHLEICGPVARKTVLDLAQFAPTPGAKSMLLGIARNRNHYRDFTSRHYITLAGLLQRASPTVPWVALPLAFVIECLRPLQPRYYSISSSPVISPRKVAITALVVNKALAEGTIPGLASNYLLSLTNLPAACALKVAEQPKASGVSSRVLAHIRKSKFKLPITSSTPLVLICTGTGFAPFRAFLQERTKLFVIGKPIGKMLLFFGCRDENDYIYKQEIESMQSHLRDHLEIITAFSRGTQNKVYVQDRVREYGEKVLEMLESGANMYICGQAAMAREVDVRIEAAAKDSKHLNDADVKAWADALKRRGKWKVDVWG